MNRLVEQLPAEFNIAAHFLESDISQGCSDKVAFYHQNEKFTYAQVKQLVQSVAGCFSELGLEPEDRIAILSPDTLEFVVAFWGAIWLGAVPVPINTGYAIEDVRYILQDSRAKILLTTHTWREQLTPNSSPFLRHVLLVDGELQFLSQLSHSSPIPTHAQTARDEPAFWLYTSGSTGRPKGVIHLHSSMVVCAERYIKAILGLNEDDIVYSVARMPFAYGLGNTLYMPMAVGASAVLADAQNAFEIIADIHRYRPTVLFGIPSVYAGILAVQEIAPLDVSSLRLCISAAEQLPKTIWSKWKEQYGLEICEGIGTTELLHIFLSNTSGACRPGSSGRPVPGYDVQVVNGQGIAVAPGEIGDLQVSGESLMLGYWNRLKETRQALYGETMRTGDKYLIDDDGYFWFMGRKDDFFKVNGMWVSPFEIEDVLLQHDEVLDAAVVPDSRLGEQLTEIIAYLSLKPGVERSPHLTDTIRRWAKSRLPHFKAPKQIHIVDSLPRTPTGKIHRQSLLREAVSNSP